jgi:outer membrane protein assembly factor BamA
MIAPNIMGLGALKTENGTTGYGGGALLHFDEDRWRCKGSMGDADINVDFYTGGALLPSRKIAVNMKGMFSQQQVSRRLGVGDLFFSGAWTYLDIDPRLEVAEDFENFTDVDFAQINSGLGLALEYDTRDNIFTPSRGYLGMVETDFYLPAIGSDVTFQSYRAYGYGYWPLGSSFVLGARGR